MFEYHYKKDKEEREAIHDGDRAVINVKTSTFDGLSIEKGEEVTCVKKKNRWVLSTDDGRVVKDVQNELINILVKKV